MKVRYTVFLMAALGGLLVSCATGQYMQLKQAENMEVLGSVQSTFAVNGSFRYRSTIDRQAYITLLAEAQKKYPDVSVDIRDISWVIGKQLDPPNYEYLALGKVVKPRNN
jgi:hypothetical protein